MTVAIARYIKGIKHECAVDRTVSLDVDYKTAPSPLPFFYDASVVIIS